MIRLVLLGLIWAMPAAAAHGARRGLAGVGVLKTP
jgi:hypothetical protein